MVRFSGAAYTALTIGLMSATSSTDAFTIPTKNQRIPSSSLLRQPRTHPSFTLSELRSTTTDEIETTTTTTTINTKKDEKQTFTNDGLFAWMQPYLDLFGFVEGNTVYYGPGVAVDESKFPSKEEQQRLREEAEENMMNIGLEERERRRQAGDIAYKVVFAYAILSSIFLDDGTISGNLARFAIALVRMDESSIYFSELYTILLHDVLYQIFSNDNQDRFDFLVTHDSLTLMSFFNTIS